MSRRHCKIARLPRPIQEELNRRIEAGIPGRDLLRWLNALPEVLSLLYERFESDPIDEQNLADWRTTGFPKWQSRQLYLKGLEEFAAQARQLDPVLAPMASLAASMLSRQYARLLSESITSGAPIPDRKTLKPLLDLTRAVASLRRLEQQDLRIKQMEEQFRARENGDSSGAETPGDDDAMPLPYSVAALPESFRLPPRC